MVPSKAHLVHRLKHTTQRRRAETEDRHAQARAPERAPRQQCSHPSLLHEDTRCDA